MQPRLLAIFMVVLPLLASNGAFLLSASDGLIPWCMPYIDGCSTISRAGRSGDTIFFYRALVFTYAVLFMLFWAYTMNWLDTLHGQRAISARVVFWLGLLGSVGLLIYINYLGTAGEFNVTMRRIGAALYFILIPFAQFLLLYLHYSIHNSKPQTVLDANVLRYQLAIVLLMLLIIVASILLAIADRVTYEVQNIVEWNASLLVNLYSAGMIFLWKDYRLAFSRN